MYPTANNAPPANGYYGAMAPVAVAKPAGARPSGPMLCITVFVPWFVFCAVFSLESFSAHFTDASLSTEVIVAGLVVVALLAMPAVQSSKTGNMGAAFWQGFLAALTLVALLAAVALGSSNYENNMRPYYDISNANDYHTVDPALYNGNQMMDAGRIEFTPDSFVDVSRSMAFRNSEMYCVAPIVSGNKSAVPETYDFWAVGLNCCSGHSQTFHCGEYNMVGAHSAIRLMKDDLRPFFRLAVQQAEAAFNIEAQHPLFFYWMSDPDLELRAYEDAGYKQLTSCTTAFLIFLIFAVVVAFIVSSKM